MSVNLVERKLAKILAADVSGYSRMMEADEAGTLARLRAHIGEVVRPRIAAHRGNIVKTTGDGLFAEFASAVEAVESAVEIQRSMAERNTGEPDDSRILYRVGINLGDVIFEDGDVFGDGVNVASRLEGLAKPGGLCISDIASGYCGSDPGALPRHRQPASEEHFPTYPCLAMDARRSACAATLPRPISAHPGHCGAPCRARKRKFVHKPP